MQSLTRGRVPIAAMFVVLLAIAGCSETTSSLSSGLSSVKAMVMPARSYGYSASDKERECLARAMFFESNRSSRDGLIAVGSVVMNRKETGRWGNDICDVVGAKRQFAPGVLSRPMNSKALPDVMAAADAVLKGERHPKVDKDVMYFHTAGLKFPYKNMRYTTVAGGNAFYYKSNEKQDRLRLPQQDALPQPTVMVADATPMDNVRTIRVNKPANRTDDVAPAQVAFADEAADVPEPVTMVKPATAKAALARASKARSKPDDEMQVAFDEDAAPMPEPMPVSLSRKAKAKPQADAQVAFAEDAPLPAAAPKAKALRKTARNAVPKPKQTEVADAGFEEPLDERFGGAPDAAPTLAYGDGGGNGNGILGQLVIRGSAD